MNRPSEPLFATRPTVTLELPLDKHTVILHPEQVIVKVAAEHFDIGALCYALRSNNARKPGQPRNVVTSSILKQRPKQILRIIKALSSLTNDGGTALTTTGQYTYHFTRFLDWTDANELYDCLAGGEATRNAFRAWATDLEQRYKRQEFGEGHHNRCLDYVCELLEALTSLENLRQGIRKFKRRDNPNGGTEPLAVHDFAHALALNQSLFDGLCDLVLEQRPFPYKLGLPKSLGWADSHLWLFPTNVWRLPPHLRDDAMRAKMGPNAYWAYDYENGRLAIDHVRQIVGDASPAPFAYIGNSAAGTASDSLFELLLWTLDHPAWARRDGGAAMVMWLARTNGDWLSKLARLAVSMDRRNRADIASATLDILSREDPAGLWQRIESHIEVARVVEQCRHVGRFATFMRIADRASKRGVDSAMTAFKTLQERFPESFPSLTPAPDMRPPSFVPTTLHMLWRDLSRLGLLTEDALHAFAAQVADSCSPLTVEMACALESLVAKGGREDPNLPTGRWASMVRYALNTALFQPMPASKLRSAEASLRAYNPESLLEPENGRDLLASLVVCLESGRERNYRPSHGELVFLDLQCFLEMERRVVHVELTSHLVPPRQPMLETPTPHTFKATEMPQPGPDEPIAVCGRAMPTIAYFGSISPAIPTPRFLHLVGTQNSNTVRYHWRDGGTVTSLASGRRYETALLAIKRDALSLPGGWQLRWALRINGEVRAVLSNF